MLIPGESPPLTQLRTVQILAAALIFGVVTFAAVSVVLTMQGIAPLGSSVSGGSQAQLEQILLGVELLLVIAIVPVSFLVPRAQLTGLQRRLTEEGIDRDSALLREAVMPVYGSGVIVGSALLEGAALYGVVVCLLTGRYEALLGAALCVALMLARFPTTTRLHAVMGRVSGRDAMSMLMDEKDGVAR